MISTFFPLHHYMNYLQFLFCQYTFFVINFNLIVNLSTFKIFNPHISKSLSFTNFISFLWGKSFSLVFILLFNALFWWVFYFIFYFITCFIFLRNSVMKSLFDNLVTKHVKISYIIISCNFSPHITLTLILSLFTLCIRNVKIMLINLKCHVSYS